MLSQTTQPIWSQIDAAVKGVPGWSDLDQLYSLYMIGMLTSELPGDIIEIGAWCGRSAVALGLAARTGGRGRVHCIDLFPGRGDWFANEDGTYSMRVNVDGKPITAYMDQRVWAEPFERTIRPVYEKHENVLEIFRETMASAGLQQVVQPFRGTVEQFFASMPGDFRCRMAVIDGDHGYEGVSSDIRNVLSRLVPGGWLCLDDAFSTYDGIDRAVRELVIGNPEFDVNQQLTRKFFVARKRSGPRAGA